MDQNAGLHMNPGQSMIEFITDLFPICRSITGKGTRETLQRIAGRIPLKLTEIPTGTRVFDWEIPQEWNINDAYIIDPKGNKIVDFQNLNLHVLNYSTPFNDKVDLKTLKEHLFTIPEKPSLVPYRTSYYSENWGFCLSHNQYLSLEDGEYEAVIDSSLTSGSLTYGEAYFKGESEEEMLISTHICHPSLCNDNLTGIAVCTFLADYLSKIGHHYSYRFLFIPGTIGAIAWLAQNEKRLDKIRYGLVASLLGLDARFTYKRTRAGNAKIDTIVEYVIGKGGKKHDVIDFIPYGYDERQFCSPGINLPVGNVTRIPFGEYPEYHTSADNLDLISANALYDSYLTLQEIITHVEGDRSYVNLFPKCEPQLGKRGLYDNIGGRNDSKTMQLAFLWILNFSDGNYSLTDICMKSGIKLETLVEATDLLISNKLIEKLEYNNA